MSFLKVRYAHVKNIKLYSDMSTFKTNLLMPF